MAEWLPQITPQTSFSELIERPSAFNPEPQLMDRDFLIDPYGSVESRRGNPRHDIRYSNGQEYNVQWPIVCEVDDKNAHVVPLLTGMNRPQEKYLEPFSDFWDWQAVALTRRYFMEASRASIDKIYEYARKKDMMRDPQRLISHSVRSYDLSMRSNKPEAAYAIAVNAFSGKLNVGGVTERLPEVQSWIYDQIVSHVEPGIDRAFRSSEELSFSVDAGKMVSIRCSIAEGAIELAEHSLAMRALIAAEQKYQYQERALTEKIVRHQAVTGMESVAASQKLSANIRSVPENIRSSSALELNGTTPKQVGEYVLAMLS